MTKAAPEGAAPVRKVRLSPFRIPTLQPSVHTPRLALTYCTTCTTTHASDCEYQAPINMDKGGCGFTELNRLLSGYEPDLDTDPATRKNIIPRPTRRRNR